MTTSGAEVGAPREPTGARDAPPGPPPAAGFDVAAAYDAHGGELLAFALVALRDRQQAEDCVQEVFVRAWRARDRYDPARASLRTWLFAIARNAVVDAHRARARRPEPVDAGVLAAHLDPAGPDAPGGPAGSGGADAVLDRMQLAGALAGLPPEHRQVVVEVHLDGRSYAEVAARTGVRAATLRTRMFYALRSLRAAVGERDGGGRGGR